MRRNFFSLCVFRRRGQRGGEVVGQRLEVVGALLDLGQHRVLGGDVDVAQGLHQALAADGLALGHAGDARLLQRAQLLHGGVGHGFLEEGVEGHDPGPHFFLCFVLMTPAIVKTVKLAKLALAMPLYARVAGGVPLEGRRAYARWLRLEVERAGCVFIKIGQWVASRTDVFPPEVTQEFATLKTGSAPMPPEAVSDAVRGLDFETFDPAPVSTGSIAQVHRGVFRGRDVAVKVQRPGLLRDLEGDVGVIKFLLGGLRVANRKMYDDLVSSLDDLITTVTRELDFEAEAAHMDRFRAFFAGSVVVPGVLHVTPRVIVMDFVDTVPFTGSASCLMEAFFRMFFQLGWLHTDMHSGNVAQTPDGTLVLFDFGSVLECPDDVRLCIKHLMVAYLNRNVSVMVDYMLEYGLLVGSPDAEERAMLEAFVANVLDYVEITDTARFAETLKTIPAPATGPTTVFRPEIFFIMRSFTLLEGLCKELDPDFVILEAVAPLTAMFANDPMMYRLKVEDDIRTLLRFTRDL